MNSFFNDLRFPWALFLIWALVYILIGPGIPYTGTILGAFLLSLSLFLSFRTAISKRSWKGFATTFALFFIFVATIIITIYLVTTWFQIVATLADTSTMEKSRWLINSKSAWQDKDWEKSQLLAKFVFQDYGFRIAYHNEVGDIVIYEPDTQDFESRDSNIEMQQNAVKIFPTLIEQAERHRIYVYIYLAAFFSTMGLIFLWNFKKLPKNTTDNIKINGTR